MNLFYEIYDEMFRGKDYAAEVDAVLRVGGVAEGDQILEIGSGTGNHTLACAARGIEVMAVETDPRMVAVMRTKLDACDPVVRRRVDLFAGPVETMPDGAFSMGMAMFNVVNYIDSIASLQSFFVGVSRVLAPGASFTFDSWNGVAALLDPPRGKHVSVETDQHVIDVALTSQTDRMRTEAELTYSIVRTSRETGSVERGEYQMKQILWAPRVLSELAAEAGLVVEGIHPLLDVSVVATSEDWKILFLCKAAQGPYT